MKETPRIQVQGKALGGGALPVIITPLVGATPAAILDEIAIIAPKKPDLFEWRIDFFAAIGDLPTVLETARAIRRAAAGIPLLLTCRRAAEGGQTLTIDEAAVVDLYAAVCVARGVELIDYELSNAPADIRRLRALSRAQGITMIMSFHDFQATPDAATLDDRFATAARLGADVAKLAVMPRTPRDVLELLAATDRARQTTGLALISLAMGGLGALSRLAGWIYGSAATFAVGHKRSAPGQIAIEDLRAALAVVQRSLSSRE